jgi:hypothetical protein
MLHGKKAHFRAAIMLGLATALAISTAHSEIVTVSVTGDVTSTDQAINGIAPGTPFTWRATYDDTSPSEVLYPTLEPNFAIAEAILSYNFTLGKYAFAGNTIAGNTMDILIDCCTTNPYSYPDSVAFDANGGTGPQVTAAGGPYNFNGAGLLFWNLTANVLPTTATPTASELTQLQPSYFIAQVISPNSGNRINVYASTTGEQISVAGVPEPGTIGLAGGALLFFAVSTVWRTHRRGTVRAIETRMRPD